MRNLPIGGRKLLLLLLLGQADDQLLRLLIEIGVEFAQTGNFFGIFGPISDELDVELLCRLWLSFRLGVLSSTLSNGALGRGSEGNAPSLDDLVFLR